MVAYRDPEATDGAAGILLALFGWPQEVVNPGWASIVNGTNESVGLLIGKSAQHVPQALRKDQLAMMVGASK